MKTEEKSEKINRILGIISAVIGIVGSIFGIFQALVNAWASWKMKLFRVCIQQKIIITHPLPVTVTK